LRTNSSGSMRWAIYRPANNPGDTYENKFFSGSWSGWVLVVDPAIFTRLAALEYDTSPRAFTPSGPGFTGEGRIVLQRVGDEVTCRFEAVGLVSGISDFSYLTDAGFIPQGFRPGYSDRPVGPMSNPNANPVFFIGIAQGSRFRYQTSIPASSGARIVTGQMKWKADTGARPTAPYPGTAA